MRFNLVEFDFLSKTDYFSKAVSTGRSTIDAGVEVAWVGAGGVVPVGKEKKKSEATRVVTAYARSRMGQSHHEV